MINLAVLSAAVISMVPSFEAKITTQIGTNHVTFTDVVVLEKIWRLA